MRAMGASECCGGDKARCARFDRFYCTKCMGWAEPRCECGPVDDCPYPGECPPTAAGAEDVPWPTEGP